VAAAELMSPQPLVSVIVPAWNSERTLLQTLRSVAAQSYSNLEIIIVDDGSTDGTASVARRFCKTEPRAKLIQTENKGVSCARNRAIAESLGDWIAPIDADDIWHPSKIEKQMQAALQSTPEDPVGFIYCWHRQIDEDGRLLASGARLRFRGRVFGQLAYVNPVENGSAPLFSRAAISAVGGYDEDLPPYEDPMVQLRIAQRYRVAFVPEHLVGWRSHDRNASKEITLIKSQAARMYARLAAEGAPLPANAARWTAARLALLLAEEHAIAGQPLAALRSIAEALFSDPARSASLLLYRALRSVGRRLAARASFGSRPLFEDIDPASEIVTDPYVFPKLAQIVERIDRSRLKRLAASE
jgi:glycosyltransferase involved in cell wall biosynthesis